MIYLAFNYVKSPFNEDCIFRLDLKSDWSYHGSYHNYEFWQTCSDKLMHQNVPLLYLHKTVMAKLDSEPQQFYIANRHVETVKDGMLPNNYYRKATLHLVNLMTNKQMMDYIARERYRNAIGVKDAKP